MAIFFKLVRHSNVIVVKHVVFMFVLLFLEQFIVCVSLLIKYEGKFELAQSSKYGIPMILLRIKTLRIKTNSSLIQTVKLMPQ